MSKEKITISEKEPLPQAVFDVEVQEKGSSTKHTVEMDEEYYKKITKGGISPEELIRKSFEFLLAREPKESILSKFNLRNIEHYFPEYVEKISSEGGMSIKKEE